MKTLSAFFLFFFCSFGAFSSDAGLFRPLEDLPKKTQRLMNRGYKESEKLIEYNEAGEYPISEVARIYEGFNEELKDQLYIGKLKEIYDVAYKKPFLTSNEFFHFCYQSSVVAGQQQRQSECLEEGDEQGSQYFLENPDWDEFFEVRSYTGHEVILDDRYIMMADRLGYFGLQTWLNRRLFQNYKVVGVTYKGMPAHGRYHNSNAALAHDLSHEIFVDEVQGIEFYRNLHRKAIQELSDEEFVKHCVLLFLLLHEDEQSVEGVEDTLTFLNTRIEKKIEDTFLPEEFKGVCNLKLKKAIEMGAPYIPMNVKINEEVESVLLSVISNEVGNIIGSMEDTSDPNFVQLTFEEGVFQTDQLTYLWSQKEDRVHYLNKVANNGDIAQLLKGAGYNLQIETEVTNPYKFMVHYSQQEAFDAYTLLRKEVMALWRQLPEDQQ